MTIIHHPADPRERSARVMLRQLVLPMKGAITGPDARAQYDEVLTNVPAAAGVEYERAHVGGVGGLWCRVRDATPGAATLYFHGGAYVVGSAHAYRHFVGQIAARAGTDTFVPDYALAPERPFPAAVIDARAVFDGLVAHGITRIALTGDSAGAGLALVLLRHASARARNGVGVRPVGAAVISALTDLALTGASLTTLADVDPLLDVRSIVMTNRLYLGDTDPRHPDASPLYGDLTDLPPVVMHVGSDDILLDDSTRFGAAMTAAGSESEVHVWDGMIHVFPSNVAIFAAARDALDQIGEFIRHRV